MALVHPRWLSEITGLFPDKCRIQRPNNSNVRGDVIEAPWADVAGLVDLDCRVSPADVGREVRGADQTYGVTTHIITLRGRYTNIEPHMRAVVNGIAYDIQGITGDGCGIMTRLSARVLEI